MHYLFYFVDFLVYFAFCLMLDPLKVGNSYHACFQKEKLLQGEVIFPRRRDIEISDVKAMNLPTNNFSKVF